MSQHVLEQPVTVDSASVSPSLGEMTTPLVSSPSSELIKWLRRRSPDIFFKGAEFAGETNEAGYMQLFEKETTLATK